MTTTGLQAGVGARDISPRKPMFLCGYPHAERTSTGIHDPLWATALCLTMRGSAGAPSAGSGPGGSPSRRPDHDQSVLLVAVDNLFVNPPVARQWRQTVSARTGVPEEGVFISMSHTHSGPHTADVLEWGPSPVVPPVDEDYLQRMQEGIVAAAIEAATKLRPAELGWTTAMVDGVGGNRHDPEHGARDPEVGLLAVRERGGNGKLMALDVTYCMHPTVLHEDSTLVSSDFPHYTRVHLRENLGLDLTVLYHTGPAGNQSTRHHVQGQTFAEAERLGRRLGAAILPAVEALRAAAFDAAPVLAGALAPVRLPLRALPTVPEAERRLTAYRQEFERLKKVGAPHGPVRTAECDVFGAEETLYLAQCKADGTFQKAMRMYDPLDVQVVRIGDSCVVGLPGELFVEYSLLLKWLARRRVFPVNLVNGETQGYVVTEAALREGRYETNNRGFEAAAGRTMVDTALGLIAEL